MIEPKNELEIEIAIRLTSPLSLLSFPLLFSWKPGARCPVGIKGKLEISYKLTKQRKFRASALPFSNRSLHTD